MQKQDLKFRGGKSVLWIMDSKQKIHCLNWAFLGLTSDIPYILYVCSFSSVYIILHFLSSGVESIRLLQESVFNMITFRVFCWLGSLPSLLAGQSEFMNIIDMDFMVTISFRETTFTFWKYCSDNFIIQIMYIIHVGELREVKLAIEHNKLAALILFLVLLTMLKTIALSNPPK